MGFRRRAEYLEDTKDAGSPEVVKKSYQLVERVTAEGNGMRFFSV